MRGLRIGRYSKRHGHIGAYVEVTAEEFGAREKGARGGLLVAKLCDVLQEVSKALEKRSRGNIRDLIEIVSSLSVPPCPPRSP